jgi:hypothetical protein
MHESLEIAFHRCAIQLGSISMTSSKSLRLELKERAHTSHVPILSKIRLAIVDWLTQPFHFFSRELITEGKDP